MTGSKLTSFVLAPCLMLLVVCIGCSPSALERATVYELTHKPETFVGRDVAAVGTILMKRDSAALAVLLPGVSINKDGTDLQPIYISGEPAGGAVWLDGLPAGSSGPANDLMAGLHETNGIYWGAVEARGRFERGKFGPDGVYEYSLTVTEIRVLQRVERVTAAKLDNSPGEGKVSLIDLADRPATHASKHVTTQGYYFWSPATSGLLAEAISYERVEGVEGDLTLGNNPRPEGRIIFLEGFPPQLSSQLNIGPANSHVWGPVELTGQFEAGGKWGPNGEYNMRLSISDGKVTVLGK